MGVPSSDDFTALIGLVGHHALSVVLIVGVLWLVATRLAETHESAVKVLGPLGRWMAKRYRERNRKFRDAVNDEAKILALELMPKVVPADYEAVKVQLNNITARVADLEVENEALRSFVVYDEEWHFTVMLASARNGGTFPHRYTWLEFRDKWRHGWRPHQDSSNGHFLADAVRDAVHDDWDQQATD